VWLFLTVFAVPDLGSAGAAFFHLTHTAEFTAQDTTTSARGFTVTHGRVHDTITGESFEATLQDATPKPGERVEVWVPLLAAAGNVYTGATLGAGLILLTISTIVAGPPAATVCWLLLTRARQPDKRTPPTARRDRRARPTKRRRRTIPRRSEST